MTPHLLPRRIDTSRSEKLNRIRRHLDTQLFPLYHPANLFDRDSMLEPPKELEALGFGPECLELPSVGFGGTTSPCADGAKIAQLLAQVVVSMRPDAVVVSGGVLGIDQAAHMGALDNRGKTIAVLANPVGYGLHPYVPARRYLEQGILQSGGGLVSEYREHDFVNPTAGSRLRKRDGIISALSHVFIAVECSEGSDTTDTAARAQIQGNCVIAIEWDYVDLTWHHEPERGGSRFLIDKINAEPFPNNSTGKLSVLSPDFAVKFTELVARLWSRFGID